MNTDHGAPAPHASSMPTKAGLGFLEFIVLAASFFALTAFSIDIMLPALPQIGESLALTEENDRQLVLVVFSIGFGVAQIFFGPISDRFGRRSVLYPSLALYVASTIAAGLSGNLTLMLTFRLLQGVACAGMRTIVTAIVRDCFDGREMARVMSYVFTVFMLVPVFAPAVGQLLINVASWHWIFVVLAAASLAIGLWSVLRLRETLDREDRMELSYGRVGRAFLEVVTNRLSIGYTLALTMFFGGLFAFIVSVQQIFVTVYGLGDWFVYIFALSAVFTGISTFLNGHFVRRVGMRRISHSGLVLYFVAGTILWVISLFFEPPFLLAYLLISAAMFAFGMIGANFNSMAMEPMGHMAGTAASVIGAVSTTGGAVLGGLVGRAFDGSVTPLAFGFAFFGAIAIGFVYWAERGRFFAATR